MEKEAGDRGRLWFILVLHMRFRQRRSTQERKREATRKRAKHKEREATVLDKVELVCVCVFDAMLVLVYQTPFYTFQQAVTKMDNTFLYRSLYCLYLYYCCDGKEECYVHLSKRKRSCINFIHTCINFIIHLSTLKISKWQKRQCQAHLLIIAACRKVVVR